MNRNKTYHICLGTPEDHFEDLENDAGSGGISNWTINSKAKKGDYVLFYMIAPISALVAKGVVLSDATRNENPRDNWFGYFESDIVDLEMLKSQISLSEIRKKIPEWGYWKTPIKSTCVPDDFIKPLERLLGKVNGESTVTFPDVDEIDMPVKEGRRILALHFRIERKPERVKEKKAHVIREKGRLKCEACSFDFEEKYGTLGKGFCEVHHKIPLSEIDGETETRLEDLAILCSNCHRMIHRTKSRTKPIMSVIQFKKRLKGRPR